MHQISQNLDQKYKVEFKKLWTIILLVLMKRSFLTLSYLQKGASFNADGFDEPESMDHDGFDVHEVLAMFPLNWNRPMDTGFDFDKPLNDYPIDHYHDTGSDFNEHDWEQWLETFTEMTSEKVSIYQHGANWLWTSNPHGVYFSTAYSIFPTRFKDSLEFACVDVTNPLSSYTA